MTKFIIVRHGQSEANLKEIYAGRFDVPLTATGKKQAELVTEYVLKTYRVDAVYSSPLLRARETVKEIAIKAGVPLLLCDGIEEIFGGEWEGKTLPEIAKNYAKDALLWKDDIGGQGVAGDCENARRQERSDRYARRRDKKLAVYFRKQADKLYERAGLAAQRFRFGSEFRKRKIYARKNGLYGASGRSDYPTFESLTASTRFANLRSERRADEFCRKKAKAATKTCGEEREV